MSGQDLPKRPRNVPSYPEPSLKMGQRSCPRCGGTTFILPEGLQKCYNCKFKWQSTGFNWAILERR